MPLTKWIIPLVLGGSIELCLIGVLALGDLGANIPIFFLLYGFAGVAYGIGIWQQNLFSLPLIWIFAVVFRGTLLFSAPSLSDDIFRYVWDGRVLTYGINPYLYSPDSEALMFLRESFVYPYINHPHLPTIYPPVAQFVFALAYWIFQSIYGFKLIVVLGDLLLGWVLVRLLHLQGKCGQAVLIYLWHPLVVIEGAGSGHMDFLGVLVLFLALWAWYEQRDKMAFIGVGVAVLVKFLPIVFIPALIRWSKTWFPQNWKHILWLPIVVVIGYLPFVVMGGAIWGSLGTYAANWEFNSLAFGILKTMLGDGLLARQVMGGVFVILVLTVTYLRLSPIEAGFCIMASFVVLTPTLHPWYLIWLIPFLVLYPRYEWVGFSLVVVGAYEVLILYRQDGVWEESGWVWGIEFGTLLVLGGIGYIWQRMSKCCMS
jgi:hypothetical protein